MKVILDHTFEEIIAIENLLEAWSEFIKDKRNKQDVQDFQLYLLDNLYNLHNDLKNRQYQHGGYHSFNISDPKPRSIHKATVYDRLLHHAIHRKLYSFFDKTFISDSFSCRTGKGTHKALERFTEYGYKLSRNNFDTCWILKCDIRKFFANINHKILMDILAEHIKDENILWLLQKIISSFEIRPGVGLPLGNLTSQLFVNVYMNEFDQFVKHKIKAKHYIRYADDFVFFSKDKQWLEEILPLIRNFLSGKLKLELHPDKLFLKTLSSGVDFLGWVHFPTHQVLRTTTKRRMLKNFKNNLSPETLNSYLGLLRHGDTYYWQQYLLQQFAESQGELYI
jgi:retron-type reverse transcriptase